MKEIDYLFEDPPIQNQKFALVSIVGPHMPQKCDVWALKMRGVTDTLEKAKSMTQKLLRIDNNYDIYTVEVGKFFPLAVEPHQVSNVEYQNSELNKLIKGYLENRELANEFWHKRKDEMIKEAIKEGRNQEELARRPEHPVSVLQRMRNYEKEIEETRQSLQELEENLEKAREKFNAYTDEEQEIARKELESAVNAAVEDTVPKEESSLSVDEIREQLLSDLGSNGGPSDPKALSMVDETMVKIKETEQELNELRTLLNQVSERDSPITYNKLRKSVDKCEKELSSLKERLKDKDVVNDYINSRYNNTLLDGFDNNVVTGSPLGASSSFVASQN